MMNKFSFKRVWYCMRWNRVQNEILRYLSWRRAGLLLLLCQACNVFILYELFAHDVAHGRAHYAEWLEDYRSFMVKTLWMVFALVPPYAFSWLRKRSRRQSELMLPATNLERFAAPILQSLFAVFLAWAGMLWLGQLVQWLAAGWRLGFDVVGSRQAFYEGLFASMQFSTVLVPMGLISAVGIWGSLKWQKHGFLLAELLCVPVFILLVVSSYGLSEQPLLASWGISYAMLINAVCLPLIALALCKAYRKFRRIELV